MTCTTVASELGDQRNHLTIEIDWFCPTGYNSTDDPNGNSPWLQQETGFEQPIVTALSLKTFL